MDVPKTTQQPAHNWTFGLNGWSATFANLSAVGVLIVFLWHLTTVEIPRTQQAFHEEIRAERLTNRENLLLLIETHDRRNNELVRAIADNQKSIAEMQVILGRLSKDVAELVDLARKR